MIRLPHRRSIALAFPLLASFWASSCVAPLGPGYTIESQEIHVQFEAGSDPKIRVDSDFHLRNTGNRPLSFLELRLPGRRYFRLVESYAAWDGARLAENVSPGNPRDALFTFPGRWNVSERHSLHISSVFQPSAPGAGGFSFASDAFFLPSEGWAPELLPSVGLFPTGGVPPKQWRLSVRVPGGFIVHTSGRSTKTSRSRGELTVQSTQTSEDHYPFVVAGLYKETPLNAGQDKVVFWTRAGTDSSRLTQSADGLVRAIQAYNATFGERPQHRHPFWIVECPVAAACFTVRESSYAPFLSPEPSVSSPELASLDTVMMDFTSAESKPAAAAPALAATWLGYGQNPGFYEQIPPLSALPAFASALGQEAVQGQSARVAMIRRALQTIPVNAATAEPEHENAVRAKSFLFFFALEDRFGQEVFRRALNHMLSARWERGFNLSDLIAAFEQESHQNVAEFVRLWMKHRGVPGEFRARYESSAAVLATTSKETLP